MMAGSASGNTPQPSIRVLYIAYWGLLEPLGQSLVVPVIRDLARRGAGISVLSWEKGQSSQAPSLMELKQRLREAGVEWHPQRYHKRPRVPATLFDILVGWFHGALVSLRMRCQVVHARTFVGGLIGVVVAALTRAVFVYHNEGFYPDEQVDAGVWRAGSAAHRLGRRLERLLYEASDGIIVLSRRSAVVVRELPGVTRKRAPVVVVPSGVDLQRFEPGARERVQRGAGVRFVYAGSVGGRYRLADAAKYVAAATTLIPGSSLTVLSWAPPDEVSRTLEREGLPARAYSVRCVAYPEVAQVLREHDVGLHFAESRVSGIGGSPTKVGEYWASGLPVAVTPGMGDIDDIIRTDRVGVLVVDWTPDALRQAILDLRDLLREPDLASRCRAAAKAHYDQEGGCEAQVELYRQLL